MIYTYYSAEERQLILNKINLIFSFNLFNEYLLLIFEQDDYTYIIK